MQTTKVLVQRTLLSSDPVRPAYESLIEAHHGVTGMSNIRTIPEKGEFIEGRKLVPETRFLILSPTVPYRTHRCLFHPLLWDAIHNPMNSNVLDTIMERLSSSEAGK